MLLLLCFALAYAIQGAVKQSWADGSKAAKSGYTKVRGATTAAVKKGRASDRRGVRWAAAGAHGAGALATGGFRLVGGTGRALWTGGKAGWEDGRRRGRRRWARRRIEQRRRRNATRTPVPDGQPSWWNYLTGLCPGCGHTPSEAATEIPGCECTARDWGCACARRRVVPEPVVPPLSLVKDTDDDDPPPADPPPASPGPPPLPAQSETPPEKETPMPAITGEAVGIQPTRNILEEIGASATTYLDTAGAAKAEAEEIRQAAERMRATLSGNNLDGATLATIASLMEQARRLENAADELASAADGTRGASATALDAVNEWSAAEEAIRARGHAVNSEWLLAGA